jgi:polyisoprenyl-phosphate glycosyltransferase
MSRLSIVVPVYFNAESLVPLLDRMRALVFPDGDAAPELEWVFVDDGSGDESFEVLQRLCLKDNRVKVLRLSRNFGSNQAILAGLTYATGDAAIVISADLQDPPEVITELFAGWQAGAQVVVAARRKRSDPLGARLSSTLVNRLLGRFVFKDFPRDGFDFMLIDRKVINLIVALCEKNSYVFGQALWAGFKRRIVHYDRVERRHGHSRWTFSKKIKYLIDILTGFSYLPLRFASLLGVLLACMGFLYALVIVGLRVLGGVPVAGWASLTIVILLTSGVQLLMLGVLGEYIWRILDQSRNRPPFIVAEASDTAVHQKVPRWALPPDLL